MFSRFVRIGCCVYSVASHQEGCWFNSHLGSLSVEFACSHFRYFCCLTQPKHIHIRPILATVNLSVDGCLSLCLPAVNCRLVLGVTARESWDNFQHHCGPEYKRCDRKIENR